MANDKLSEQSIDFAVHIINLVKQLKEQRESIFRRKRKMNKIVWSILILSLLLLSAAACDAQGGKHNLGGDEFTSFDDTTSESVEIETVEMKTDEIGTNEIETDEIETDEIETDITVDEIIRLFDNKVFYIQEYNSSMIATIYQNIGNMGLLLNGEILEIVHITDQSVSREDPDWSWAYIYEFSNEEDAIVFEENRRTFVVSTEENGACIRCGKIVVFGSASAITSIE